MSSKIPPSLKWLIDKRARIDAEIRKTKKSLSVATGLIAELSQLEETLSAIDKTLELHKIKIDISLITPVQSHYVRIKLPYGELNRSVLLYLRLRRDEQIPAKTKEIIAFVEARNADLSAEPESRVQLNRSVQKCLDRLYRKGLLTRHHDPKSKSDVKGWSIKERPDLDS